MNTCIHCDAKLGENLLLPEFPVGRTLAFDPADHRLWTVCPKCGRWNLSWLDDAERQQAVTTLEQYFAATPHKAAVDGIAVAEVGGAKLIRVGGATWPTFAGWRYAPKLWRRRLLSRAWSAFIIAYFAFYFTPLGRQFDAASGGWVSNVVLWSYLIWHYSQYRALRSRGAIKRIEYATIQTLAISVDERGWHLFGKNRDGEIQLHGADAVRALATFLPLINQEGGSPKVTAAAVQSIQAAGGPSRYIVATLSANGIGVGLHVVRNIPREILIALEIAINEEAEKAAFRGDLASVAIEREAAARIAGTEMVS